jgi:hypothetical protein
MVNRPDRRSVLFYVLCSLFFFEDECSVFLKRPAIVMGRYTYFHRLSNTDKGMANGTEAAKLPLQLLVP